MIIQRDIELTERRCTKCGRWYAFELEGECPTCAYNERQGIIDDNRKLRRAVAALKGRYLKGVR